MTHENIPQAMAAWMINQHFSLWAFLLVVNILLLAAGNVMEPSSILLILAPILFQRRQSVIGRRASTQRWRRYADRRQRRERLCSVMPRPDIGGGSMVDFASSPRFS